MKLRGAYYASAEGDNGHRNDVVILPEECQHIRPQTSSRVPSIGSEVTALPTFNDHGYQPLKTPKRQRMSDFFRATGANLKFTGSAIKTGSAKLPQKIVRPPGQFDCMRVPSSEESSLMSPPSYSSVEDLHLQVSGALPKSRSEDNVARSRVRRNSNGAHSNVSLSAVSFGAGEDNEALLARRPLKALELRDMFVGAPQFTIEKAGDAASKARVTFLNAGLGIREGQDEDCADFEHESFELSALAKRKYLVNGQELPLSWEQHLSDGPNILNIRGLEPGTVGFETFLRLSAAERTDTSNAETTFPRRRLLKTVPETLGLRTVRRDGLVDCLTANADFHHAQEQIRGTREEVESWSEEDINRMGEDLFAELLPPPTPSADMTTISLETQILALRKALEQQGVWYDFSNTQWRQKIGELLWGPFQDTQDDPQQPMESDVLLLQLSIAAELLVRLDAVSSLNMTSVPLLSEDDHEHIAGHLSNKVLWDLFLARRFLESVNIAVKTPQFAPNNRASRFSVASLIAAKRLTGEDVDAVFSAKEEPRQVEGLIAFADALEWPDIDELKSCLKDRTDDRLQAPTTVDKSRPISAISGISIYVTPPTSPSFIPDIRSPTPIDPMHGGRQEQLKIFDGMRPKSREEIMFEQATNCFTRSWLSSLILPGDAANRFLLGSLIETSPDALAALGAGADFTEGFAYRGRQFWSKSTVVGRVLSTARGATESMGWVSIPGVLADETCVMEGWMKATSLPPPLRSRDIGAGDAIASDSAAWPINRSVQIKAGDFITPLEGPPSDESELEIVGLSFPPSPPSDDENTDSKAGAPHLVFKSPLNANLPQQSIPLTYDVHFVTSYPCYPAPNQNRFSHHSTTSPNLAAPSQPRPHTASPNTSHRSFLNSRPGTSGAGSHASWSNPPPLSPLPPAYGAYSDHHRSLPSPLFAHPPNITIAGPPSTFTLSSEPSSPSVFRGKSNKIVEKSLPTPPAHPLHVDALYETMPAASLLSKTPPMFVIRARALTKALPPINTTVPALAEDDKDDASTISSGPPTPPPKDSPMELPPWPPSGVTKTIPRKPVTPRKDVLPPRPVTASAPTRPPTAIHPALRHTPTASKSSAAREVLVLDCRGEAELEVLARAWCSSMGEHALIGRTGRTCVACCVREARGLGMGVVIRI